MQSQQAWHSRVLSAESLGRDPQWPRRRSSALSMGRPQGRQAKSLLRLPQPHQAQWPV